VAASCWFNSRKWHAFRCRWRNLQSASSETIIRRSPHSPTQLHFRKMAVNAAELSAAWDQVRDDRSQMHWVAFRASDDLKSVELAGTGTSGFDEFLKTFEGAETAMWGGMRVRAVDDRGTIKSVRAKFIRLSLLPDTMPVLRRAKAGQLKAQVDAALPGTHASFDISKPTELTRAVVTKQLQATCGAHQPSYYDFDGAEGADAAQNKPVGSTSTETPASPPPSTASGKSNTVKSPAEPPAQAPAAIHDAYEAVRRDGDPTNWIAVTYDGKDVGSARVLAIGSDGLDGLKDALDDELVVYAALRVTAIDDRGSVKSVRAKYVFVQFIGSGVKPVIRAKAGPMKSHFENILNGTHLSVNVSSAKELTAEDLQKRLQASCGAHQPNRYEFGKQITDVADF
jgi:hypothetical protein